MYSTWYIAWPMVCLAHGAPSKKVSGVMCFAPLITQNLEKTSPTSMSSKQAIHVSFIWIQCAEQSIKEHTLKSPAEVNDRDTAQQLNIRLPEG